MASRIKQIVKFKKTANNKNAKYKVVRKRNYYSYTKITDGKTTTKKSLSYSKKIKVSKKNSLTYR